MDNTLRKDFVVSSYDIDQNAKARLTSIANYLQETAYYHADSLDIGYRHLAAKNNAWILSRLKISMLEYPGWDDHITVETWPRGIEKLFALRDFRVYSEKGIVLAKANTCWLMVNMESHRPLRLGNDFVPIELRKDAVFESTPEKITLPTEMKAFSEKKVKYSDLDIVGHVNNVKYIEWCLDILDSKLLIGRGIEDIEINYLSEAKIDDTILLSCSEGEAGKVTVKGSHKDNERECFRASLKFF